MTRTNLMYYVKPLGIGIELYILSNDGTWEPREVFIDTGAEHGVMPIDLLRRIQHRIIGTTVVEEAGLAGHEFEATLAEIIVKIKDADGKDSRELAIEMMFADTYLSLVGFEGFLNEVTMWMDVPNRTGYIEII